MKSLKIIAFALLIFITAAACQDDLDDNIRPANELDLNDFIWKAMNAFYLNKSEITDLANDRFTNNEDYSTYLKGFSTPEQLFDSLTTPTDRFSIIVSDFRTLENTLNGVRIENGMRFALVEIENTQDVFGYVRYVLPNSPAENLGVTRGMLFNKVNGIRLNVNTNFSVLFSGNNYTISLAELENNSLTDTNIEYELNKVQLTEQVIHKTEVFESNEIKVAYLMYNGFRSTQEAELNAVFGEFASQGVNELVLDLRYNSGGDLRTSVDLSSMITGQFAGQLFATQQFNENFEDELINFTTQNRNGSSLNSLNLSRVFILTSPSTASASEMVISGLTPYINVIQIGTSTVGKYQASTTLYDSDNFRRQNASVTHRYALQPIISKLQNANGFTDFDEGLIPDIELKEDFNNLGELGSENEPLLRKALIEIGIISERPVNQNTTNTKQIFEDNSLHLDYQKMYTNQ